MSPSSPGEHAPSPTQSGATRRGVRRRRGARRWWWLAAGVAYLSALTFATWLAFAAAAPLHRALSSKEFRAALAAALHPLTQADLPRLLPGIPIYRGAKFDPIFRGEDARSAQRGEFRIHLFAPASAEQIRAFYARRMKGWRRVPGGADEDLLFFERGRERCAISIMPELPLSLGRSRGRAFAIHYSKTTGGRR